MPLVADAIEGRGGRGIAGGGEGRDAAEELLRRLDVRELLRSWELSWFLI